MPKIRSIKPESCQSPTLARLSERACLLFAYLPCFCDDWGVMPYHPAKVKALVFPLRPYTVDECEELVGELVAAGIAEIFEAEGRQWLHVVNFCEHQKPNRRHSLGYPVPPSFRSAEAAPDDGAGSAEAAREQCAGSAVEVNGGVNVIGEVDVTGGVTVNGKEKVNQKERPADVFDVAEPSEEDVRRVVTYINRRCRKRLSAGSPSVREPIAIRLAQGHPVDDLVAVVNCKARAWEGWDKAPSMLTPKTLFGRKFGEYLADAQAEEGGRDDRGMYD